MANSNPQLSLRAHFEGNSLEPLTMEYMPTAITVVLTDWTVRELSTNQDYESVVLWCREMVEHNDIIDQIIVNFDEGKMIFEAIN